MIIRKDDNTIVWGGFKKRDFYPKKDNGFTGEVTVQDYIMQALGAIKNWYGLPIIITCTVRSKSRNAALKEAAPNSHHLNGAAIDFQFWDTKRNAPNYVTRQQYENDIIRDSKNKTLKDSSGKETLYGILKRLGVGEFIFYASFCHIALDSSEYVSKAKAFGNKTSTTENIEDYMSSQAKIKSLQKPSTDWYEDVHQDSSITTVSQYLNNTLSPALFLRDKPEQFLNYNANSTTNLISIFSKYTSEQRVKFSKEYSKIVDDIRAAWESEDVVKAEELVIKRREFIPTYDKDFDYEINLGTKLYIPQNKANVEVFAAIGQGLFQTNQDIKSFVFDEFQAITNDPTYIKIENVKFKSNVYDINYLHINYSVWVYVRSLDKILNITPFIINLKTTVTNTGDFSFTLNDIPNIEETLKYSTNWYSYFQKIRSGSYNLSFWQKYIQQNDIVWIRFEELGIEKRDKEEVTFEVDKNKIAGKIYDMMGLIDRNSESYSAGANLSSINISGRDMSKMLIEDGCYFYPFMMIDGAKDFFLNYNYEDKVFKRLFNQGEYLTLFTKSLRSIRDTLGFIFNQLTNIGVLPDNSLFDCYRNSINPLTGGTEDRTSKIYELIKGKETMQLNQVNGVWNIIRLLVDNQLDDRRLNNGEITSPDGSIFDIVNKVCDPNFVEFWGDTTGDLFTFIVRTPPFTKKMIKEYFDSNLVITITSRDISGCDFDWEDQSFTWFEIQPYKGLWGGSNYVAAATIPKIYFEEFANVFGIHKKSLVSNYISYSALEGNDKEMKMNPARKAIARDIRYVIESNIYLPFTRKGSIQLRVGDRRIKRGSWIYFQPTNEIFYVNGVSNSLSVGSTIDRVTDLVVSRGMIKDYVIENGDKSTDEKGNKINYFDVVNLDYIESKLQLNYTEDGKVAVDTTPMTSSMVNKDVFDFFVKRKQFK